MPKTFSYNKKEKLKSRTLMNDLFAKGNKPFLAFPVKVFYMEIKEPIDSPIKLGVGASGRTFKKAVDRNKVKRLLRESYRLNKLPLHEFVQSNNKQIAVFLLFIDKTLPTFELLQQKMPILINKLIKALSENTPENN